MKTSNWVAIGVAAAILVYAVKKWMDTPAQSAGGGTAAGTGNKPTAHVPSVSVSGAVTEAAALVAGKNVVANPVVNPPAYSPSMVQPVPLTDHTHVSGTAFMPNTATTPMMQFSSSAVPGISSARVVASVF